MSRLIIDGNSVFEIDEECVKERKVAPECNIAKYLVEDKFNQQDKTISAALENRKG